MDSETPIPTPTPATAPAGPALPVLCPSCGSSVPPTFSFCPKCGKQLKEVPLPTTAFTKIWIYGMSLLLPPLGLWPGIKYFKNSDPEAKQIGMIAIVLSVVATVGTIWLIFDFLNVYINAINGSAFGL